MIQIELPSFSFDVTEGPDGSKVVVITMPLQILLPFRDGTERNLAAALSGIKIATNLPPNGAGAV